MNPPVESPTSGDDEAGTGLPVLRTWRGVYLFVLGFFALCVGALSALTWLYGDSLR